mgnify:CR=1 FL=1
MNASVKGFNTWIPAPGWKKGIFKEVFACLPNEVKKSSTAGLVNLSSPIVISKNLSGIALNNIPTSKGIGILTE